MARPSDDIIQAANAFVSTLGVVAADTVVGGAGTALSGAASVSYLRQRLSGKVPDFTSQIAEDLQCALKSPQVHMPKDADRLIPQMLERARPNPQTIMQARRDPEAICDALIASLTDPAHKTYELTTCFRAIVAPILRKRLNDPAFSETLRPAFETSVTETLSHIAAQVETLTHQLASTAQELGLTQGLIIGLAQRVSEDVSDYDAAMRELRRAVNQTFELQQRDALPSNLDDAVDHVMQQVSALNAEGRIDDAATLIAEEEARAEAGLLRLWDRGIAQAILTRDVKAAVRYELKKLPVEVPEPDSHFAALLKVQDLWCTRGRDKGLNFDLEVAIHLAQASIDRASDPDQRGAGLHDLGTALSTLGQRDSGTARLEEAVVAYRAALEVRTRERVPQDWAMTQNNLGNALWTLGQRESRTARLEEAVVAYRAALKVRTRDQVPLDWAATQNNLGNALRTLGERESGTARLEEAVVAYRAALQERTRDRVPLDWAMTQNNLGTALSTLGERESGTARLEEAVVAFRAALEEYTRDRVPLGWAATQNNLGTALRTLGERESGTARLEEAVVAFRAVLEEWTQDRVPLDWAMTQNNLGTALWTLGERESGTARLEEAVGAYRAALQERTRELVPLDWASTQFNLSSVELAFFDKIKDTAHLDRAEAYVRAAREVFEEGGASHYLGLADDQLTEIAALRTDPGD